MSVDQEISQFVCDVSIASNIPIIQSSLPPASGNPFYRVAEVNKLNDHWQPGLTSGDSAIAESWVTATGRLRQLVENDPVFQKVAIQLETLTIGGGLVPFASAVIDEEGNEDDRYNDESDIWFERWADKEADARGELSLYEMQKLSFGDMIKVGASFLVKQINNEPGRICPLEYQLIEWEQLAVDYSSYGIPTEGLPNGHEIQNGIEYNKKHHKVAIWVYLEHPYDDVTSVLGSFKPTRIPIENVIHNYIPTRISNTTGISWFIALAMTGNARAGDVTTDSIRMP